MSLFDYLKNIFLILILLQIIPTFLINIRKQWEGYVTQKIQVGVIDFKGALYDSESAVKQLHTLFKNNEIKALLIKMECPGSTAGTGQVIFNELQALKKEYPKPVIVLVENICTSGGYLIACGADYIIAPDTALIGNIGVAFSSVFQLKDFIEQYKVKYVPLKAGTYKTITDPFVAMTPADQNLLQGVLDDIYATFTKIVAQSRSVSLNQSSEWADGKVFSGNQAHKLGLIDELGSWSNAITAIKNRALIEGEIEWVHVHTERGFFSTMFGQNNEDGSLFTGILHYFGGFLENRSIAQRLY